MKLTFKLYLLLNPSKVINPPSHSTPFEEVNNKYINLLKSMEKPTKYFYRILIEKIAEKPLKSQNKWKLFLGKEVSDSLHFIKRWFVKIIL
jgi:hypothetical protein